MFLLWLRNVRPKSVRSLPEHSYETKRVKNQQLLSFSLAASVSQEDDMHHGTSGEDFEPERANLDAPTSSVHQEDIPSLKSNQELDVVV